MNLTGYIAPTLWLLGACALALCVGRTVNVTVANTPVKLARIAPLAVSIVTAIAGFYLLGATLDPVPVVHDESAYLLQAQLMVHGKLVGAPAPIPAFFEQFHVFVTPALAVKYPPGQGLVLAAGEVMHAPALLPLIVFALAGLLVFLLTSMLRGPMVGALAWLLWLSAPVTLRFLPSYLSETTTVPLFLCAWFALAKLRDCGGVRWVLVIAGAVGFAAATRPVAAVALAIPALIELVRLRARWARSSTAWIGGALVAACPLVLFAFHNHATTGRWSTPAYTQYPAAYMPWDRYGFSLDTTPAPRVLPSDHLQLRDEYLAIHRRHIQLGAFGTAMERTQRVLRGSFGVAWPLIAIVAMVGLVIAWPQLWGMAVSALLLFALHVPYAHADNWLVYYAEMIPALTIMGAVGAGEVMRSAVTWGRGQSRPRAATVATGMLFALSIPVGLTRLQSMRRARMASSATQMHFRASVAALPAPNIVFVRYGPAHLNYWSLVINPADYPSARSWIVYDFGADRDRQLAALAPGRTPFLFDEASDTIFRLTF